MESRQGSLWAVLVSTYAAATVCIVCRFFGRYLTRTPLWCDDYASLASYFMATGYSTLCYSWIRSGAGLHTQDITYAPADKVIFNLKLHLFAGEFIYASSLFLGQLSIMCLYWRIFSVPKARLTVKIILPFTLVWLIVRFLMSAFNCQPVRYFWDASAEGKCGFINSWFYFSTCLVHVLVDICIMTIPIQQIIKLRLPAGQKFGAAVMLLLGIIISTAAAIIMINSRAIDEDNISWSIAPTLVWAIVEVNLVTVSTCIPTIKPVFFWCFSCLLPERYRLPSSPRSSKPPLSRFTKDPKYFHVWVVAQDDAHGVVPGWRSVDPVDSASLNDLEIYLGDRGEVERVVTRHTKCHSPTPWRNSTLRADGCWPGQQESGSQVWSEVAKPQKSLSPGPRMVRRITIDFTTWEDRISENKRATFQ